MKTTKRQLLSTIAAAVILPSILIVNAEASDVTVSSSSPHLYFNDTDHTSHGNEWAWHSYANPSNSTGYIELYDYMFSNNPIYIANSSSDVIALARESSGLVNLSDGAIQIYDSSNKSASMLINSSGDITLANGTMFLDRSDKKVGIGTTTPRGALDIRGNLYLTSGSSNYDYVLNPGWLGLWFFNDVGNAAMKIARSAAYNTLVVGSNTSGKEGSVGIGTEDPQEKLDVLAKEDGARLVLTTIGAGEYDAPQFTSRHAGSDGSGNVRNTKNKHVLGSFAWRGHDGNNWTGAKAYMMVRAVGDWSDTNTGTRMQFATTPYNSTTTVVGLEIRNRGDVIVPNGDVIIQRGNLYVKGRKMHVPDYVFKKNYKLMPLAELEKYINTKKHLPGIKSAEQIEKKGLINLPGLQMKLLEKIEELTLYTIKQEKALASKNTQINTMKEKISNLQTRLTKLESLLTNVALNSSKDKNKRVSLK